jgi:transcriptional regulator with GAF, ATPase, and Fis domain
MAGSGEMKTEARKSDAGGTEQLLRDRASLLERLAQLEKRCTEIEEENQDLITKYVKMTQQNESLTNLYVASHQLHSTLDPQEVMARVNEILVNLVGAEEFAVFLVDRTTKELTPVSDETVLQRHAAGELLWEDGILEQVVRTGEAFYLNGQEPRPVGPLACVPLKIDQDVIGLIAIFKLLTQKDGFTLLDSDILNLMAGHAATAIVTSHMYADAERKRKTIEGFMDLLMHRDAPAAGQGA